MDDNDLRKRHYFLEGHPGHFYAYLKRRKHIVIPVVSMKENMLCDIAALALGKDSATENVVTYRENYAKQALMMFYPHRTIDNIMVDNSFWSKFVQVGGLTPYEPKSNDLKNASLRESKHFWEKGKDILHNIQARRTMEHDMSRPPDPIQFQTKKSKSTGERAKSNVDDDYMEENATWK